MFFGFVSGEPAEQGWIVATHGQAGGHATTVWQKHAKTPNSHGFRSAWQCSKKSRRWRAPHC